MSVSSLLPPPSSPLPIIIDTDPGIDDCLALLLALNSPELDIRGISISYGNTVVENAFRNAVEILHRSKRRVIFTGSPNDANLMAVNGTFAVDSPSSDCPPRSMSATRHSEPRFVLAGDRRRLSLKVQKRLTSCEAVRNIFPGAVGRNGLPAGWAMPPYVILTVVCAQCSTSNI